jgi:hypothetical protein
MVNVTHVHALYICCLRALRFCPSFETCQRCIGGGPNVQSESTDLIRAHSKQAAATNCTFLRMTIIGRVDVALFGHHYNWLTANAYVFCSR